MKTYIKISALFAFFLFGTGVFAQSCLLTINDNDNTSGQSYNLRVDLWNYTSIPYYSMNTTYTTCYITLSGNSTTVSLSYQVAPDIARLKFHIYAQNQSTSKGAWGWSQQYFDSGDYYNNNPPVTVSI